jgi:drug/metabolite transporter (DMT)-like permease
MKSGPRTAVALTPILELGLIVCWSSGFIGGTLASGTGTIFAVLFWRFLITGVVLAPWTWPALMGLPRRLVLTQALVGALAMFGYLATVIAAIDLGVPAGLAALITALQPLATAALAKPFLDEAVSRRQWLGLGIGFIGVGIAVSSDLGTAPLHAYLLAIVSMGCITAATLLSKRQSLRVPLVPTLGLHSLVSAALFLPLALIEGSAVPRLDPGFVQAVAWFILLSTIGAYGFYWACLERTSATRVASLIYLTPPTTSVWAWAMFGEAITMPAILGFLVCLLGVELGRRRTGVAAALPADPGGPICNAGASGKQT